jgi:hypothetical protein
LEEAYQRNPSNWSKAFIIQKAQELSLEREIVQNWSHNRKRPRKRLGGQRGFTKDQQQLLEDEF